jgi:hypothetical protein
MQRGTLRRQSLALKGGALVAAVAALGIATTAESAVLADYPDFADVSKLKLNGDAGQAGAVLRLTSANGSETGTAYTKKAVLNKKKSFKTEFSFSMHDSTSSPGDGMAFIVHSASKSAVGDGGGGLGFGSIGDSLIVEFDTFDNGGGDEQANEVSVIVNGKAGKTKDSGVPGFSLYGGTRYAWVVYKAKAEKVKAYVSDTPTKPSSPIADSKVNLKNVFDDPKGRAGFTAATGGSNEVHDVLSWTLKQ